MTSNYSGPAQMMTGTPLTSRIGISLVMAAQLCACGGDGAAENDTTTPASDSGTMANTDAAAPAGTGNLILRFSLGGAVAGSRNLVDPLEGPVYGSIFRRADVTLTGPAEGAEGVESVFVESVDLRERDVSEATWEAALPTGDYTFLGYWDIDHSYEADAGGEPGPENGDPVPLPETNQFSIEAGETLEYTATFELIYAF